MSPQNEDFLFAQEAQRDGYVTEDQVEAGFGLQRRMLEDLQIDERLSVILVKRGWLDQEQAQRVYARLEPEGRRSEIDGYDLIEKIGSGSMGTVYKAMHQGLGRPVAIKILRSDLTKETIHVERLKEEAKLLASLDHPNIVRALDAGESAGFPYVVMEYVEGESLKEHEARHGPFGEIDALKIVRAVSDALERARRMGVVHRDVKPGNIILSKQGEPKLMDLGLAKGPVDLGLTQHGATVGTPQYISPEQAQDPRRADTRSDIYSLGATLYAMLTGRPPFSGQTLAEVLTKVLYEEPTPIRVLNKSISPEAAYLVERMMLKDPGLRYRTPSEVVKDIDEILAGRSIVPAGFRGNWEAFLLRKRIRRGLLIGAVAAVLLLAIGTGIFFFVREREREVALRDGAAAVSIAGTNAVPGAADGLHQVQKRLMIAQSALDRWRDVRPEGYAELETLTKALRHEVDGLERILNVEQEVTQHLVQHRFLAARTLLERFEARFRDSLGPVRHVVGEQLDRVQAASRDLFDTVRREKGAAVAHSLADHRARWEAYEKALSTPFLESAEVKAARDEARGVGRALAAIEAKVAEIESAFADAEVAPPLEALAFAALRSTLDDRRRDAVRFAEREWEPWELVGGGGVRSMRRHVEERLDAVEHALDRKVEERYEAVEAKVAELARAGEYDIALNLLSRFRASARRAGYVTLHRKAEDAYEQLETASAQQTVASAEELRTLLMELRDLVCQGDAEALRRRIDAAVEKAPASWLFVEDVAELRILADGLDVLRQRALEGAREAKQVRDVRLRDGTDVKRWFVYAVNADEGTLVVSTRKGGKKETRRYVEIHPEQRLVWAALGGREVPPPARAVAGIATCASTEPDDLRPAIVSARRLEGTLREAGIHGAFLDLARKEAQGLEIRQAELEADVRGHWTAAEQGILKSKYELAYYYLKKVLDPEKPYRFTTEFEKNHGEFREGLALAEAELANEKLARHFPGAHVSIEGQVTTVDWDFEDPAQLEVFRRGEGRACGAIAPGKSERVITPGGSNWWFQLLPGAEGLVRDCPLVLPCIFDPAETITLEFTLFTQTSPFFLAFDLDGLQVAVLSADPTSNAYKQRWRFPPDIPTLKEEREPPNVNWYGRGRGVAFHARSGFGDPTNLETWKWPTAGMGRNLSRWPKLKRAKDPDVFAFAPRAEVRVRIVRERGKISLFVGGKPIASRAEDAWAELGAASDRDRKIRKGSGTGRLQIWTWTPMAIDDLEISGHVLKKWR